MPGIHDRRFAVWLFAAVIGLCISACGKSRLSEDRSIFHFNLSSPVTSLDPAFASDQSNTWAVNQLYNGLVQLDARLQVQSCIARTWSLSDDRLVYTFTLRQDVYFHDDPCFPGGKGRAVVAEDVLYSFNRLLDPSVAARGNWVFNHIVDSIEPFRVINDSTVAIVLQKPFAPFLQRLSIPYCSIVPREAVEHYGVDFRSHPVGTGPFKFVQWEEGELIILHRFENYFEQDALGQSLPYLDAVNINFISNKSTEFLKFLSGELDFVSDIDAALKDNILTKDGQLQEKYRKDVALIKGPYLNVEYFSILMDTTNPLVQENPLSIAAVRKAINMGFDRKEMLLFLKNNRGRPATAGIVPPSLLGDPETHYGYGYDPDSALALLREAGFENGVGLPEIVLHTTEQYQDIAVYIKNKLEDIGVALRIETVDPRLMREMRLNGTTVLFRSSWIADYADAENYLTVFYGGSDAPPNYTRYRNPAFDALYAQAVEEPDADKRLRMYRTMDSLMMQDAPVIPLFYDEVFRFTRRSVTGLEPNGLNMLDLRYVRKQ